nr:betaine--homocysteine S-methyltransferase [Anaerolineae bacterium]
MKTTFQDLISSGKPVIADGAMGTILFELGLTQGDSPELWNVEHPDRIRNVHRAYIEAGAQIILTNTFGCNRYRLKLHKLSDRAIEFNQAAASLARTEADEAPQPVIVAGDMGPTGSLLKPYGDMEFDDAVSAFAEQAGALAEGGVDILWIETMSDLEEVRAAVEGARRAAPQLPLVTTMTFDTNGRTMFGVTPERAFEVLIGFDVVALGGNCGNGIEEIETVVSKMHALGKNAVLIAKANAGVPHLEAGVPVYDAAPSDMGRYAVRVRNLGATIIGACCGSTPDHIRAIAEALK